MAFFPSPNKRTAKYLKQWNDIEVIPDSHKCGCHGNLTPWYEVWKDATEETEGQFPVLNKQPRVSENLDFSFVYLYFGNKPYTNEDWYFTNCNFYEVQKNNTTVNLAAVQIIQNCPLTCTFHFENCTFSSHGACAIYNMGNVKIHLKNCIICNPKQDGGKGSNGTSTIIEDCYFYGGGGHRYNPKVDKEYPHSDGIQWSSGKRAWLENTRCEWIPFRTLEAKTAANAGLYVDIEDGSIKTMEECVMRNCFTIGGGYATYLITNTDKGYTISSAKLLNVKYGCNYGFGPMDRRSGVTVDVYDYTAQSKAFISSVWKEGNVVKFLATNYTNQERNIIAVYGKDGVESQATYTIAKCPTRTEQNNDKTTYANWSSLPFDRLYTLGVDADYVVFYDTSISEENQIRYADSFENIYTCNLYDGEYNGDTAPSKASNFITLDTPITFEANKTYRVQFHFKANNSVLYSTHKIIFSAPKVNGRVDWRTSDEFTLDTTADVTEGDVVFDFTVGDNDATASELTLITEYQNTTVTEWWVTDAFVFEVPSPKSMVSIYGVKPKSKYVLGETFSTDDLTVMAHYSDTSLVDVTSSATIDTSNVDVTTVGTYPIYLSYTNAEGVTKTSTKNITVRNIYDVFSTFVSDKNSSDQVYLREKATTRAICGKTLHTPKANELIANYGIPVMAGQILVVALSNANYYFEVQVANSSNVLTYSSDWVNSTQTISITEDGYITINFKKGSEGTSSISSDDLTAIRDALAITINGNVPTKHVIGAITAPVNIYTAKSQTFDHINIDIASGAGKRLYACKTSLTYSGLDSEAEKVGLIIFLSKQENKTETGYAIAKVQDYKDFYWESELVDATSGNNFGISYVDSTYKYLVCQQKASSTSTATFPVKFGITVEIFYYE